MSMIRDDKSEPCPFRQRGGSLAFRDREKGLRKRQRGSFQASMGLRDDSKSTNPWPMKSFQRSEAYGKGYRDDDTLPVRGFPILPTPGRGRREGLIHKVPSSLGLDEERGG